MKDGILQDWDANRGNWKSCLALALYRAAQAVRGRSGLIRLPVTAVYVLLVEWGLGIELNVKSRIGRGLRLYHGCGLVIHEAAVVGENCILRHNTTLGAKNGPDDCPVLGDHVDVGCNVVILGRVKIGDGARIGAGSVVLHDVPAGDVVAGNPARSVRPSTP
jgi:putative colanic acid biosynthesis acetyltransferase WcaB